MTLDIWLPVGPYIALRASAEIGAGVRRLALYALGGQLPARHVELSVIASPDDDPRSS